MIDAVPQQQNPTPETHQSNTHTLLKQNTNLNEYLVSISNKIEHLLDVKSRLIGTKSEVSLPQNEEKGKTSIKDIAIDNVHKAEMIDDALANLLNELDHEVQSNS